MLKIHCEFNPHGIMAWIKVHTLINVCKSTVSDQLPEKVLAGKAAIQNFWRTFTIYRKCFDWLFGLGNVFFLFGTSPQTLKKKSPAIQSVPSSLFETSRLMKWRCDHRSCDCNHKLSAKNVFGASTGFEPKEWLHQLSYEDPYVGFESR